MIDTRTLRFESIITDVMDAVVIDIGIQSKVKFFQCGGKAV